MKRLAFAFLALSGIPAFAAYTWTIAATAASNGSSITGTNATWLRAVPMPGCGYILEQTFSAGPVIRTTKSVSTETHYVGNRLAVGGDTAPAGTSYYAVAYSSTGVTVTYNGGSTLYSVVTSISTGATLVTVVQYAGLNGSSQPMYRIGMYINGSQIGEYLHDAASATIDAGGGMNKCNGQIDMGDSAAIPGAVSTGSISKTGYLNHVDLAWSAASDSNGLGVLRYKILKLNNSTGLYEEIGTTTGLSYSDTNVVPNQTYTYKITTVNWFFNEATTAAFTAQSALQPVGTPMPSTSPDGRQVGVRTLGTYWGDLGENIDVRSGNLNFALPVATASTKGGLKVGFGLSYNSQTFMKAGGANTRYGRDIGYGFGWMLMVGSITPKWNAGGTAADYYLFRDGSGAEYRLNVNTSNVWTSTESTYIWFDASTSILYFRDGTRWYFGGVSASGNEDAGTMYPTWMKDTVGSVACGTSGYTTCNTITVAYANVGGAWTNSTGVIAKISDQRTPSSSGTYQGGTGTFYSNLGDNYSVAFGYTNQTIKSPIDGTSYGTMATLTSVTNNVGDQFAFTYNADGELTRITLPKGGYLDYTYGTVTYSSGRQYREVTTRKLSKTGSPSDEVSYVFQHESSLGADVHACTVLDDPGGLGRKYWAFNTSGTYIGLTTQYEGRHKTATDTSLCSASQPGTTLTKTRTDFTWTQDAASNSYVATTITTSDPGQAYSQQKKIDQTVSTYGNVTQTKLYSYTDLVNPLRTLNYTYLNTTYHVNKYIRNRMLTATSTEGGVTLTLVTNVYDSGSTSSGYGRLTSSTPLHGVATTYSYNTPGQVTTVSNINSTQLSYTSSPNEVLPTQVTVNSVVTQSLNYSSTFNLLSLVGANTETTTKTYDSNWRPDQTTIPQGAKTYNVYTTNTSKTIISSATPPSPDDGQFTKVTVDGLGRTIKQESGTEAPAPPGGGVVIYPGTNGVEAVLTQVDTEYDSCGCAPLGKLKRTSMPHAPGGSVVWTTYSYDGIGRTVSVVAPDGASTSTTLYEGNTTKVTDAAGKWKKYTYDSFDRLVQVNEPNPAGGSDYVTTYTYDMLDHLIGVSMPRSSGTQTRTFNYIIGTIKVQIKPNIENIKTASANRKKTNDRISTGYDI